VYNHARHATTALSQGGPNNKLRSKLGEINSKEQMMAKFIQLAHTVSIAVMIATLSGCGEEEKKAPPPTVPAAPPLTVGGSVSGLAGGELVLQLNGVNDLTVKADGAFKFTKPLTKGSAYAVTVKTPPALPVKQTCAVSQGSGNIAGTAVSNVAVVCTTNTYAVGGTVSGLSGKGLVLELKGGSEVKIAKNGNFIFPDTRLPDGSDYSVAIKATPVRQKCKIVAIATAPDSDTLNIVAVTCSKKGRR
jgi:hypothetical protein